MKDSMIAVLGEMEVTIKAMRTDLENDDYESAVQDGAKLSGNLGELENSLEKALAGGVPESSEESKDSEKPDAPADPQDSGEEGSEEKTEGGDSPKDGE